VDIIKNLSIRKKLIGLTAWGVVFLAAAVWVVTIVTQNWVQRETEGVMRAQMEESTARIAMDIYNMVSAQDKLLQIKVQGDLAVARELIALKGGIKPSAESVEWKAVNQFNRQEVGLSLRKMMAGSNWLGKNTSNEIESLIVDKVRSLVGGACTIFQRMNEQGDMLRVSTNVIDGEGNRAIGTFIPAVHPDGSTDPILAAVLKGETYSGQAFVVNAWYIAAYEPIRSPEGEIVGMLFVGAPMSSYAQREVIMNTLVGKTGYVYVIGGKGSQKGRYIISQNGKRDGENIWDSKDSEGKYFIQEIVNKGMATNGGACSFVYYPWKNPGEKEARRKIAAVTYYEPWDWVIGAGAYEDECLESLHKINGSFRKAELVQAPIMIVILILTVLVGVFMSRNISLPLTRTSGMLRKMAEGDYSGALAADDISRGDEIGVLARSAETLHHNMSRIIKDLSGSVETIAESSSELSNISVQMASGTREMAQKAKAVVDSADDASSAATSVATKIEDAATNMAAVASATEMMSASIGEIASNSEKSRSIGHQAVIQAQGVSEAMKELGTAANEIGKVSETITNISTQTNLLALNATIEAARAGAAGKGFAVVANEIKELAQQTAAATEDIKARINGIQSSTNAAIVDIEQITSVIQEVGELATTIAAAIEEQSVVTKDLAHNIAQASNGVTDANGQVSMTAAASQSIARDIAQVNTTIREFSAGGEQVQSRAFELAGLAEHLKETIKRFKLSSDESADSVCSASDALMGNCVPATGRPFVLWNEGYSVEVLAMDDQHKRFFSFLNELHAAMKNGMGAQAIGRILLNLAEYTDYHFKAEEDLMEKCGYPELARQKEAHSRFIQKVAEIRKRYQSGDISVISEALSVMRDWLINHIQKMDKKYGPYMH
jgi:methyl-accepting chemotaxis protein